MPEPDAHAPADAEVLAAEHAWLRLPIDRIGLVLGPTVLIGWLFLVDPGSLSPEAHRLAGIMLLTVIWWVTEPIPIPATGILAVVLSVLLGAVPDRVPGVLAVLSPTPLRETPAGRGPAATVLAYFAEPSVFFMLGGLFIGRAMARHGLDRRIALAILCARWAGRSPATLLAAVGIGVMLVSMWISNTAATAMMYPVTVGIIAVLAAGQKHEEGRFVRSPYATALLMMTAFASSVGGIATPIGTATNMVAIGFFRDARGLGQSVDFLRWSMAGVPLMMVIFLGLYGWLRLRAPSAGLDMPALRDYLHEEYARVGPWRRGEINTLIVFAIVVGLWVAPGMLALTVSLEAEQAFSRRCPEEIAALLAPVLLFLLPVNWKERKFTLEASDLRQIDWGIILLFGSGLALGGLMLRTGLADEVGKEIFAALGTRDLWVITGAAIVSGILLSEITGNAAAASTLLPVILATCKQAEIDPIPPLFGVTFGASFGSALPVSTPPNAIVYSSGLVPIRRMILAGIGLDLICTVAIWSVLRIAYLLHWKPFLGS